jgi:nicotinate phosphoribosyltransferase
MNFDDFLEMPIFISHLDVDFYKFPMGQMTFHRHPDNPTEWENFNRTKNEKITDSVSMDEIAEEFDAAKKVRFAKSELHYLRGTNEYSERMFKEDYLSFLADFQLGPYSLEETPAGECKTKVAGPWSRTTYWEIPALEIISELRARAYLKTLSKFERHAVFAEGIRRLHEKIKKLREHPDITIMEFGTRRRFLRGWQEYVVKVLKEELSDKQFLGTSNTYLAMKYDLLPMGTCAHEEDQGYAGIFYGTDQEIRDSMVKMRRDWWDEYGWGLSISLTDTFGSDFYFNYMPLEIARDWKGNRQDSGDPIKWTDKDLFFYLKHKVDSRDKMAVYSDGLDIDLIIDIHRYVALRLRDTYGVGTNLTNDLGIPALSHVMKLMRSNGHATPKLSDNVLKALGLPETIEKFKRIFYYTNTTSQQVRY